MAASQPHMKSERRDGHRAADSPPAGESRILAWLERVRGEYQEMPGLSLTEAQAQRLWGLDATVCRALLDALSQVGFLHRTDAGAYVRGDTAL